MKAMLRGILSNRSRFLRFLKSRPKLEYIIDATTWSPYWDGYYLVREFRDRFGIDARVSRDPRKAKNTILHFGDRYVYVDLFRQLIHPSNKVFITWFHGDPADRGSGFDQLFAGMYQSLDQIERIVVPCRITFDALHAAGISEQKLAMIPLGVDLSVFQPARPEEKTRVRKLLGIPEGSFCIGSFQKDGKGWEEGEEPKLIKGPDLFIDTIAELRHRYRDIFVLLTGPARGYIKKHLSRINVPFVHHRVEHYHDMAMYYGALDLYLITSRCEGGPKALLESWACGVPLAATRVGMVADCVNHRRNGMVVPLDRAQELAESVAELREDPSLRETIIAGGLTAVRGYDWKNIAKQYVTELYKTYL